MKNRALLLCIKNELSISEYCDKIGIDRKTAEAIFKDTFQMDESIIFKNCELFNVSRDYFLCLE